jgi:hypothetical protein
VSKRSSHGKIFVRVGMLSIPYSSTWNSVLPASFLAPEAKRNEDEDCHQDIISHLSDI